MELAYGVSELLGGQVLQRHLEARGMMSRYEFDWKRQLMIDCTLNQDAIHLWKAKGCQFTSPGERSGSPSQRSSLQAKQSQ
jgi:hypothetical protein